LYYGYDPDKRAISEGAKRTANATADITGRVRGNTATTPVRNNETSARNSRKNIPTYYATRAYRNRIPVSKLNSRDAVRKFQEQIGMTGRDLDGIWGART